MFVDTEKCKRCGACLSECPFDLVVDGGEGLPKLRPAARRTCIGCGHCVAVCPVEALSLPELREFPPLPPSQCEALDREQIISVDQAELFLKGRRSVRTFKDKLLPDDLVAHLVNVARFAPSAHNGQPARWIVTRSRETTRRLAELTVEFMAINNVFPGVIKNWKLGNDKVLHAAPQVAIAHAPEDGLNPAEDCSIAAAYLELAAHAHGVGACWAGFLMEAAEGYAPIRELLGLPEGHGVYAALMLGYPKYKFKRIPRRNPVELRWLD